MLVTFSENRFSELIRGLEGITDSDAEIVHRMEHYAGRLFRHVAEYGVRLVGLISQNGSIATFQFSVAPLLFEQDRETHINGLQFMNPLSVTIERGDLPGFFGGVVLAAVRDSFSKYQHELDRVTVPELQARINDIGWKYGLGKNEGPVDAAGYKAWLEENGLTDPGERYEAIDAFKRREIEAEKERQAADAKHRWGLEPAESAYDFYNKQISNPDQLIEVD